MDTGGAGSSGAGGSTRGSAGGSITVGLVTGDADLEQILALQRDNREGGPQAGADGFVTVEHTLPILRAMHALQPSVVARQHGQVVAYALAMPPSTRVLLPILDAMFARLDVLCRGERWYVMGQVCVAQTHRGSGLFDALYAAHRAHYRSSYDLLVTEIALRNARSLRAHERVGFTLLERYRDAFDDWAIVALRL